MQTIFHANHIAAIVNAEVGDNPATYPPSDIKSIVEQGCVPVVNGAVNLQAT